MSKNISFAFIFSVLVIAAMAQKPLKKLPFSLRLEAYEINDFPALQSFSYAIWEGKWLLLGGRKDGLHRRQPWASFNEAGQNSDLYIVDPVKKQVWKQPLAQLPVTIQEQLQSTNMEFYQLANKLVLTGGYGYSKTADDHITYPYITIIKVDELINAVMNNLSFEKAFVQIKDEQMAVTGGRLVKTGDTLLLVCGQRFDGMYNPMGPDHGPGYVQQYSNEIRKFSIKYDNDKPVIRHYQSTRDTINLHRRDYNLVPQVFNKNQTGFTIFSGVFQYNEDLPYTNIVDMMGGAHQVNKTFRQQFNHYHSAVLPMYDAATATMYNVFFGGIAQYYPDINGKIIANNDVPFTKTISMISRHDGKVLESYLPVKMPGYLGAAAEFIFAPDVKQFHEGIAAMNWMQNSETFIGYIIGGINSSDQNIFFSNTGKESKANSTIIKVFIKK